MIFSAVEFNVTPDYLDGRFDLGQAPLAVDVVVPGEDCSWMGGPEIPAGD